MPPEEKASLFYSIVVRPGTATVWITYPGIPDPSSLVTVQTEQIATLKVRTGKIIVCDPTYAMFPQDCPPFLVSFPLGDWPVLLCRATPPESRNKLCLAGLVCFGQEEPILWKMGLCAGQDPAVLAENEFYGFGVDAGKACFMDAAALLAWGERINFENPQNEYDELICASDWKDVAVEGEDGMDVNVVRYSSGYGDGEYPSFIGYSAQGAICALLTLFDVFDAEANQSQHHPSQVGPANSAPEG